MQTTWIASLAFAIAGVVGCSSTSERPTESETTDESLPLAADLVLTGGAVVDSKAPHATAVACRDGRIVYVGSDARAREWIGPKTRVFPLRGASILPGLVDAHGHMLGLGESIVHVDLVGAKSYSEVVDRAASRTGSTPRGSWILGRGWDQNDWTEKSFPTHEALSARTPDHPVFLGRIDGHAGLANATALALAGVTRDTRDPDGGHIERGSDGEPTGVLVDNAMELVESVIPPPTHAEKKESLRRALHECASHGLTEVHDAGVDLDTIECYRELARSGQLLLRIYAMIAGGGPTLDAYLARGPEIGAEGGLLTVRAVKLYVDGALGSRGAALLEPYADDPGNRGLLVTEPDRIREITERCLAARLQVCVHAIGDRGNRLVLDAFEIALAEVPTKDARLRIEHAQVLSPSDVPRLAKLGVIASMQPTHATSDGPWVEARLGPERAKGAYAWRSLLRANAKLAFGSDFPVEAVSPLFGLYAAITRQDLDGRLGEGFLPEERLTPVEALAGFTSGAAYAAFEESEGGSIAVGKRADLTVLSVDPTIAKPREILAARVVATIVGGRVVFGSPATNEP